MISTRLFCHTPTQLENIYKCNEMDEYRVRCSRVGCAKVNTDSFRSEHDELDAQSVASVSEVKEEQ